MRIALFTAEEKRALLALGAELKSTSGPLPPSPSAWAPVGEAMKRILDVGIARQRIAAQAQAEPKPEPEAVARLHAMRAVWEQNRQCAARRQLPAANRPRPRRPAP